MVKETSIEAYYGPTPDKETIRRKVAQFILQKTREGKPCTRGMIERETGIRISTVCGRVKELEEEGITLFGVEYRLHILQNRQLDPVTRKSVEAFALIQKPTSNEQATATE